MRILAHEGFSHEALFYTGDDDFLDATLGFIREGLAGDEAMLVVVSATKIAKLKAELGADAGRVGFGDMTAIGTNPARIIPAWRDFVDEQGVDGRPLRGIGEPIWAGRTRPSWPSANATSRCSTWPSPIPVRGVCSAPTTRRRSTTT